MAYSNLTNLGSTPVDFRSGFFTQKFSAKYIGGQTFSTSVGDMWLREAVEVHSVGAPKGYGYASLFIGRYADENGVERNHYANVRLDTKISQVWFQDKQMSFDLTGGGLGGTSMTIGQIIGTSMKGLLNTTNFQSLNGSSASDYIIVGPMGGVVAGHGGNDRIYGSEKRDDIRGDGWQFADPEIGNDQLFGGGGNDSLRGGKGNDTLDGGAAADTSNWSTDWDIARFEHASTKFKYLGRPDTANSFSQQFEAMGREGTDRLKDVEEVRYGDNRAPLMKWHIVAEREQDGLVRSVKFFENGKEIDLKDVRASAYDEATPLIGDLTKEAFLRIDATLGSSKNPHHVLEFLGVGGRTNIQMHNGNFASDSEGCLVVPVADLNVVIDRMLAAIERSGMAENLRNGYKFPVPITIEYRDVEGKVKQPQIGFQNDASVREAAGEKTVRLDLTDDNGNGLRDKKMDLYFAVSGTAKYGTDYRLEGVRRSGDNFVVTLGPGESYVDIKVRLLNNDRTAESTEKLTFNLFDAKLFNDKYDGRGSVRKWDLYDESEKNGAPIGPLTKLAALLIDDRSFALTIVDDGSPPRSLLGHADSLF